MDKQEFINVINSILVPFGFKKERTNSWIRKGVAISTRVYLQRSLYGNLYYFRDYYVINNLKTKHKQDRECITDTRFDDDNLLYQMCNLENDVPDEVRETTLRSLITKVFENHHFIETEDELKEMILKRLHPEFIVILEYLGIDQVQYNNMWRKRRNAAIMQRLAQVFESSPTGDCEIRNEEKGFCVIYNPDDREVLVRLNVFVNPYTQNVEEVYQQILDRLSYFTKVVLYEKPIQEVERIEADKPSKLGFMHVELTILDHVADGEGIERVKDAIFQLQDEQKPHESPVWFKSELDGYVCYFEGEWWSPCRAVIMGEDGYERFDFSDESKYDVGMWDIVEGDYDQLEYEDSFELITSAAFQEIWEKTEKDHEPEPWE